MEWPPKNPVIFGRDYGFNVKTAPPAGYPTTATPDVFSTSPLVYPQEVEGEQPFTSSYENRRKTYLDFILKNPAPLHFKAPFYELGRLAAGGVPHEGILFAALDFIDERKDCADFVIQCILRMLYQFGDSPLSPNTAGSGKPRVTAGDPPPFSRGAGGIHSEACLSAELLSKSRQTVLNFKYHPSEPGIDDLCSWTENHQILFATAAYLAGQRYPDEIFTNSNEMGRQKMEKNRLRILRWLDLRFHSGFSEWLSHVYYDEDLTALANLVDFCQDSEISSRAAMVMHLICLDMALNSFKGTFCSTHGRSYENTKRRASAEGTVDTMKLLFGTGVYSASDNMSAICIALSSKYHLPQVIYEIANDTARPEMLNCQRMGILIKEAEKWGLHFDNFEDGMALLSLEAYVHPRTINLIMDMFDRYNWWENVFFDMFKARRGLVNFLHRLKLLPLLAKLLEKDMCRNTREAVNIETYRTPDYLLSSAQDYRKGYGGDQQHVWQATLAPDAVCFTTHPARYAGPTPNYWSGSGTLPRVAQVKNVVIAIYNISSLPGIYLTNHLFFTHAWLPRDQFDEVIERPGASTNNGWIFARKGEGYLALRSHHPYRWQDTPGFEQNCEIIVQGKQAIWICELGRRAVDGEFSTFIDRICQAAISFKPLKVIYESPSQGQLEFGWHGSLKQNGKVIELGDYPRYDNPYCQAGLDARSITIRHNEQILKLDWNDNQARNML